jgi:hypothetical protein
MICGRNETIIISERNKTNMIPEEEGEEDDYDDDEEEEVEAAFSTAELAEQILEATFEGNLFLCCGLFFLTGSIHFMIHRMIVKPHETWLLEHVNFHSKNHPHLARTHVFGPISALAFQIIHNQLEAVRWHTHGKHRILPHIFGSHSKVATPDSQVLFDRDKAGSAHANTQRHHAVHNLSMPGEWAPSAVSVDSVLDPYIVCDLL